MELDSAAGEETASLIREAGGSARVVTCDISQTESTESAFAEIEAIDVLVNNAGIAAVGNVETCTLACLRRCALHELAAAFRLCSSSGC